MFKIPVLYVAIMIHWLVALPGSLIISSVSGIVNVMSLVVSALLVYIFWVLGKAL